MYGYGGGYPGGYGGGFCGGFDYYPSYPRQDWMRPPPFVGSQGFPSGGKYGGGKGFMKGGKGGGKCYEFSDLGVPGYGGRGWDWGYYDEYDDYDYDYDMVQNRRNFPTDQKIWIGGLPEGTTWRDVKTVVDKKVKSIWVKVFSGRGEGTGCIAFKSVEDATKALEIFKEIQFNGKSIIVDRWKPQDAVEDNDPSVLPPAVETGVETD